MKILYLCHRFPFPPRRGGKIRPFNMIRHLNASHEVTVASLVRSGEEAEEGSGLREFCSHYLMEKIGATEATLQMIGRVPTPTPSSLGYFYSKRLMDRVRRELERVSFDLIFVHCSSAAQYVADVRGIPKILDFGDMDSQKWLEYSKVMRFPRSVVYYVEGRKLENAERVLASEFDLCSCTTKAELETLRNFGGSAPTGWFPNGVDHEYFTPCRGPYDGDRICFVGRMDYFPNQECMLDFCSRTLPLIRAKRPGTTLVIVGANPSPSVRKLGQLPGVTVTGSVADVRPFVHGSAVAVAPLNIARGTQNKILESLAMGVPVVCSDAAAGGIDAVPGEHLLTASSPEEFATAVLRLLDDPRERTRFSEAGRARVLSHHDWAASMKRLDHLIESCMNRASASRRIASA